MRNIFLDTSYTKCGWEANPRTFYKKIKLGQSLDQEPENVINFVFIVCPRGGLLEYMKTKVLSTCFYLI